MLDQKFWERYFKVYDVLNFVIPYQELLEEIAKEAQIRVGDLILEAGVGTGNLALVLKKYGAKVIGLDYSQAALKIYKTKDKEAETILHNLEDLPLPFSDNYFDKIVSNNTLYNISKSKQIEVLEEFKRILKPGGKIVLSNILKSYNPLVIYLDAVRLHFLKFGFISTLKLIFKMLIPTIKVFYYNFYIKREMGKEDKAGFSDVDEQKKLLLQAGFRKVSENKYVFSNQAIMNSAYKL